MFLFESLTLAQMFMWVIVLTGLIVLNEITRRYKWAAMAFFIALPIIMSIFVWPKTAVEGTSVGTWFHWAKLYSVITGCLILLSIRYTKTFRTKKWILALVPGILAVNILEAVVRDFQCFSMNGFNDGMMIIGGPWNIMNGIAGILNILTISGFVGIYVLNNKSKDLIWPDQMWFWIIAYDIWNFAYVYNCVPDHSFYAGAALLLGCTIPAFFIQKGAWIQHRAHTLAIWMMFVMTVPSFIDHSQFAVKSSHSTTALFVISLLSLVSNIAIAIYHIKVMKDKKRNPFTTELFKEIHETVV